jgi:hypothetical protein
MKRSDELRRGYKTDGAAEASPPAERETLHHPVQGKNLKKNLAEAQPFSTHLFFCA